jgi:hypothetical protein
MLTPTCKCSTIIWNETSHLAAVAFLHFLFIFECLADIQRWKSTRRAHRRPLVPWALVCRRVPCFRQRGCQREIELSTVESTPAAKDTTKPDRRAHGRYIWKVLSTNEGHDSPPDLGEVRAVVGANDNHSFVARVDQDSLRDPRGEYIPACPFFYTVEYVSSCRSN